MGMIHAYKIIQKTKDDLDDGDLNDVDYKYLIEMQRRNVEHPKHLSEGFPFAFLEGNSSAHDNVYVGMMNVFFLLDEQKEKSQNLNTIDTDFLVQNLVTELFEPSLYDGYDEYFKEVKEHGGEEDLEDLK